MARAVPGAVWRRLTPHFAIHTRFSQGKPWWYPPPVRCAADTSTAFPRCSSCNPSATIERLVRTRKANKPSDARNPASQHPFRESRNLSAAQARTGGHVYVRPDGVRLRAHRKLPDVCFSGYSAAIFEAAWVQVESRHEFDRRG